MKSVIPFSKEIVFKTNIAEISSISLEHNYNVVNDSIKGDFVVTGEYKSHELSVNKEDFKYSLPFNIDIDEDIDKETIKMEIEDFTYEFNADILTVKIEYSLMGERTKEDRKDIIIPDAVEVENPQEFLEEANEILEEVSKEEDLSRKDAELVEVIEPQEEINESQEINEETKLRDDNIKEEETEKSEYVTYHVHVLKEEETIEMVCKLYDVNLSLIEEYNDISNIGPKDKIIIPIYDE